MSKSSQIHRKVQHSWQDPGSHHGWGRKARRVWPLNTPPCSEWWILLELFQVPGPGRWGNATTSWNALPGAPPSTVMGKVGQKLNIGYQRQKDRRSKKKKKKQTVNLSQATAQRQSCCTSGLEMIPLIWCPRAEVHFYSGPWDPVLQAIRLPRLYQDSPGSCGVPAENCRIPGPSLRGKILLSQSMVLTPVCRSEPPGNLWKPEAQDQSPETESEYHYPRHCYF